MPWGELSNLKDMNPMKSNDGPILWMRPGEQSIPTVELGKSPLKRRRNAGINELQNLKYLPRGNIEREIVVEDRTPAHADHVGFGVDRITTAAVGEIEERKSHQSIILTLISILRCAESHPLREQTVREPDNERYSHFRGRRLPKTGGEIATRPARASCLTGVN